MRKVLGVLAVSVVLGVSLVGCDASQGNKAPIAVGTPAGSGLPAAAGPKAGAVAVGAGAPTANPGSNSQVGSKVK